MKKIFILSLMFVALIMGCNSGDKKESKDLTEKDFGVTDFEDELYGFVKEIIKSDGGNKVVVDFVKFYTGDKALKLAKEDGNAMKEIDDNGKEYYILPNNYYIRNKEEKNDTISLSNNVEIDVYDEDLTSDKRVKLSLDDYSKRIDEYGFVKLIVKNGQVVLKIEADYLP